MSATAIRPLPTVAEVDKATDALQDAQERVEFVVWALWSNRERGEWDAILPEHYELTGAATRLAQMLRLRADELSEFADDLSGLLLP